MAHEFRSTSILRKRRGNSDISMESYSNSYLTYQDLRVHLDKWLVPIKEEMAHVKLLLKHEKEAREHLEVRCQQLERVVETQQSQLRAMANSSHKGSVLSRHDQREEISVFLHREKMQQGFGLVLQQAPDGAIVIEAILMSSPAHDESRLREGDEIVSVETESVEGMSLEQVETLINRAGKDLVLQIRHSNSNKSGSGVAYPHTGSQHSSLLLSDSMNQPSSILSDHNTSRSLKSKEVRFAAYNQRKYYHEQESTLDLLREKSINSPLRDQSSQHQHDNLHHQINDLPPIPEQHDMLHDLSDIAKSPIGTESPAGSPSSIASNESNEHLLPNEQDLDETVKQTLKKYRQEYPQYAIKRVVLTKEEHETSFGFSIEKSKTSQEDLDGVVIQAIRPDTPADRCDDLRLNDQIFDICGQDVRCLPCSDLVEFLRELGLEATLIIARHKGKRDDVPHTML